MFTVLLRYFELKAETLGREREKRKKFSEWIVVVAQLPMACVALETEPVEPNGTEPQEHVEETEIDEEDETEEDETEEVNEEPLAKKQCVKK